MQTTADRTESCSSSQTSPIRKTNPSLLLTAPGFDGSSCSTSPISPSPFTVSSSSHDESVELRHHKHSNSLSRSARKSKIVLDISSVPEGLPVDLTPSPNKGKPPPSPLTLTARQVSFKRVLPLLKYPWQCWFMLSLQKTLIFPFGLIFTLINLSD